MSEENDTGLGGKFWLAYIGVAIACFFAAILLFIFIGNAWYRWGFFGTFLIISAIFLAIGWFVDRKRNRRYDSQGDAR